MNPAKLQVIEDWPVPQKIKDLQRFIGFANFYRRCINKFGSIISPLTDLMKKDAPFVWGLEQEKSFIEIKSKFRNDVVLQHFDWDKPARLETDASDKATGGVLLQPSDSGY